MRISILVLQTPNLVILRFELSNWFLTFTLAQSDINIVDAQGSGVYSIWSLVHSLKSVEFFSL